MLGLLLWAQSHPSGPRNVRTARGAGRSYPADRDSLRLLVDSHLSRGRKVESSGRVLALVVPHWWPYAYTVAAEAIKQMEGEDICNVVILSNYHGAPFSGIAIDSSDAWETPLGGVPLNRRLAAKLVQGNRLIRFDGGPFQDDHTIENLLPFIQCALANEFEFVPILFGNSYHAKVIGEDYRVLADLLASNLGSNDIVVVSNDMSHFLPDVPSTIGADLRSLELICQSSIVELTAWQQRVWEMAGAGSDPIPCCSIDALKTVLQLYNDLEGAGDIRVLAYGARSVAGFASILISKERPIEGGTTCEEGR